MRILDRYVTKSMSSAFLSCIFLFLFLFVLIDLFSHLDDILKEKIPLSVLANYYLSFIPLMFTQISPMACLLSMLYSIASLSKNNEIIAMRSSGLSVWRISKSIIIFSLLISAFVFMISERFLPKAQSLNYQIKTEMFDKDKPAEDKKIYNLAVYGQDNKHFIIDIYHPKKQMLENVIMLEHDENQNVISKTVAKEAHFRKGRWLFRKCIIYYFNQEGELLGQPFYFENRFMNLKDKPADFLRQQQTTMFMNIAQLKDYINRLSKSGAPAVLREKKVILYNRFTYPITNFVIVLMGIPFAFGVKKRGQAMASLGLCLLGSFLYYVLNQVSIALGRSGVLPPFLSATLSHGLFLISSIVAIKRLP